MIFFYLLFVNYSKMPFFLLKNVFVYFEEKQFHKLTAMRDAGCSVLQYMDVLCLATSISGLIGVVPFPDWLYFYVLLEAKISGIC